MPNQIAYRTWLNVVILASCQGLAMSCIFAVISVSDLFGKHYFPSTILSTLPITLMILGNAIAVIPASYLLSKHGRKNGFLFGSILSLFGCVVLAFGLLVDSYLIILFGFFVIGILLGFASYFRFAATDGAPNHMVSRLASLVVFGGIVASYLGPKGGLIAVQIETDTPLLAIPFVLGSFIILLSALLCFYQSNRKIQPKTMSLKGVLNTLKSPHMICIVMVGASSFAAMSLTMNATPLIMYDMGFHRHHSAEVIQLHLFGMFIPALFSGYFVDIFGPIKVAYFGFGNYLLAALIALVAFEYSNFVVSLIIIGIGWSCSFVAATTILIRAKSSVTESDLEATNEFMVYLSNVIASFFAGLIAAFAGWSAVWAAAIVVTLIGLVALKAIQSSPDIFSGGV